MDLIEEAKKRYPIGTRFCPAHIESTISYFCIIVNSNFINTGNIITNCLENGDYFDRDCDPQYGNNDYNRIVYYKGKWANILSNPFKVYELW